MKQLLSIFFLGLLSARVSVAQNIFQKAYSYTGDLALYGFDKTSTGGTSWEGFTVHQRCTILTW